MSSPQRLSVFYTTINQQIPKVLTELDWHRSHTLARNFSLSEIEPNKIKKNIAKLNSTEIDFWRRLARIFRREKMKIPTRRSLLDGILVNTRNTNSIENYRDWGGIDCQNKLWHGILQEEKGKGKLKTTWMDGIRGLMGGNET